jgi:hypothetical protein
LSVVSEPRPLLTARDVAEILNTTPKVIYQTPWRRRIGLPAVRIGRALRFSLADVEALISRSREAEAP